MEPEEYLWFHLAHELGWPVSLVKQLTTVGEFDKWSVYFRMRTAQRDKEDYYLANVARAVTAANSVKPVGSLEDFLLEFESPEVAKPEPLDKQQAMLANQDLWLGMLGVQRE